MRHSLAAGESVMDSTSTVSPTNERRKSAIGACERCHKYKEKCSFAKEENSCSRCIALGEQCHLRQRKRMGRRPVAQLLPYGDTSVFHLISEDQHSGIQPVARSPVAFDRGKRVRLRRCSSRPEQRRSRRNSNEPLSWSVLLYRPSNSHTSNLQSVGSWQFSHVLHTRQGFFEIHRTFMIGPSFVDDFQSAVRRLFSHSPQILADAYSVAIKLMASRHATSPNLDDHGLTIGTCCLQRLMNSSSSIRNAEDAAAIVLLGQALLVYNTLIPSPATHIITRGTLLSVKNWYPILIQQPDLDAVTLTPVLMDTIECLVRREIPVIKLPVTDRCIVDRFLGVCTSLLPLLYELCERSYEVKIDGLPERASPCSLPQGDPYYNIEHKICDWSPELPPHFSTSYSNLEIRIMLAQARCYRLASLLVIHRLRFPLGVQDMAAQEYADEILQELSILKFWPADAATGLGLDFPLLVATLELPGPGTEIYKAFEPLRFKRQHSDELLDFIKFVTTAKEQGFGGLWFDLVHNKLHGITLT